MGKSSKVYRNSKMWGQWGYPNNGRNNGISELFSATRGGFKFCNDHNGESKYLSTTGISTKIELSTS